MNFPVVLVILDGWGYRKEAKGNAIELANLKTYQQFIQKSPWVLLDPSGKAVGLPEGQMGNSEVGHLNIGAGRVVYQELTRIDHEIETGAFFQNHVLLNAIGHAKKHNSTLHLMGLVSDGGVHSQLKHLLALIDLAKNQGVEKLRIHAFLDGRDTSPKSAWSYLSQVEAKLLEYDYPQVATVSGRYYAMDRDKRWERVEKAFNCLAYGEGNNHLFSQDAITAAYRDEITDEFVLPGVCDISYTGFEENDALFFFNFRPDRARQLTRAFVDKHFNGFERKAPLPNNLHMAIMSPYDDTLENVAIAYPKEYLTGIIGQVVSQSGIQQYRIAETEKYAHVTYFLNGGQEKPFPLEERCLIPSPKVATYDLQPEMSLPQVTQQLVAAIESGQYGFLVCNIANPDMVGHTGNLDATIQAAQAVDKALAAINQAVQNQKGVLFITADHGNLEQMLDSDGNPYTAHTTNPVPFIAVSDSQNIQFVDSQQYSLSNIAPTLLQVMQLKLPAEMTSASMLSPSLIKA